MPRRYNRRGPSAGYRERNPLVNQQVPFIEPDVLVRVPVRDPATGRFAQAASAFDADEMSAAFIGAAEERAFDRYIKGMSARGNRDLGTYRSKRVAADLRRERDRIPACLICGSDRPAKARSDWKTCSPACRKALDRSQEVQELTVLRGPDLKTDIAPRPSHGYAVDVEVRMRNLSPLMVELADFAEKAWDIPMPNGYPDEYDWRMGQAILLLGLVRDERASGRPSLVRFRRRARAYVRQMKRLTAAMKEN